MEFGRPFFSILFILPLLLLILSLFDFSRKKKELSFVLKEKKRIKLYIKSVKKNLFLNVIFISALSFLILSLMKPKWGIESIERGEKKINIVFILDNSYSMLAEDIYPSRLDKAKELILKISNLYRERDNLSLIIFSGDLEILVPPTMDFQSFSSYLININPEINSIQGTYFGKTLGSIKSLSCSSLTNSFFILLSDGESFDSPLFEDTQALRKCGNELFFIGIGTTEGAPIPIKNKDFKIIGWMKDSEGKTIITKLNTVPIFNTLGNTKNYIILNKSMIKDNEIISKIRKEIEKFKKFRKRIKKADKSIYFLYIAFILFIFYGVNKYERKT